MTIIIIVVIDLVATTEFTNMASIQVLPHINLILKMKIQLLLGWQQYYTAGVERSDEDGRN